MGATPAVRVRFKLATYCIHFMSFATRLRHPSYNRTYITYANLSSSLRWWQSQPALPVVAVLLLLCHARRPVSHLKSRCPARGRAAVSRAAARAVAAQVSHGSKPGLRPRDMARHCLRHPWGESGLTPSPAVPRGAAARRAAALGPATAGPLRRRAGAVLFWHVPRSRPPLRPHLCRPRWGGGRAARPRPLDENGTRAPLGVIRWTRRSRMAQHPFRSSSSTPRPLRAGNSCA